MADEKPESTTAEEPIPSDAELAKQRQNAARAANLAKGRARKAEKAASEKPESTEKPPSALTQAGCRKFVRLCWSLCRLVGRFTGYTAEALTPDELDEACEEAMPLVQRFSLLVTLLGIIGFPAWLAESISRKFKPAEKQKAESKTPPAQVVRFDSQPQPRSGT